MLFLILRVGDDRYAIDASQTVEILPLVQCKRIPKAPAGVAGVFNYHGTPVPLIDFSDLMTGKPCRSWMSTRIIVLKNREESGGDGRLVGLLSEQVTEVLRKAEGDFRSPSVLSHAPYLGPVTTGPDGMVQRIDLAKLLSAEIWNQTRQEGPSHSHATR